MISYNVVLDTETVVITLAEAKAHLRITHDYEDDLIQTYIDTAVTMAENYTSRSLNTYDVVATTNKFTDCLGLEKTPINSNVVITYFDVNNAEQTLATSLYEIIDFQGEPYIQYTTDAVLPSLYSRMDAVKISYSIGYTDTDDVPTVFKHYSKLVVAFLYENRSDSVDKLPRFTNTLIRPYKKWQ